MDEARAVQVLLVEDSATDTELLIHVLAKYCPADELVWAKDGAEALDFIYAAGAYAGYAGRNRPRVILLDLQLPKLHGREVLRRLKEDEETKAIPIVVLTSSMEEQDLVESYRLGANSYVSKPVEFDAFVKAIERLATYWLKMNRVP